MKWYTQYLSIFGLTLSEIPEETLKEVRALLHQKHSPTPLVSVVLIAHNEETHILSCLWSLTHNKCSYPIEILVVNNNSTDRTEQALQAVGAIYFNEPKKGPGYARQSGLNHSKGKYHICIDADTMYPPHYIDTHVQALMKPDVACTFSLWSFIPDKMHSRFGLWFYESLRDLHLRIQAIKRPELCVRGMTFGFKTELGRRLGFRTDIRRGEDGSLALAMKPYGKLIFITDHKARVLTCNSTIDAGGALAGSSKVRASNALRNIGGIFTSRKEYKDEDDNLIQPK